MVVFVRETRRFRASLIDHHDASAPLLNVAQAGLHAGCRHQAANRDVDRFHGHALQVNGMTNRRPGRPA
jgi:hypothetical protein